MRSILKRLLVAVLLSGGAFAGGLAAAVFFPRLETMAVAQLQGTGGNKGASSVWGRGGCGS